MRLQPIDLEMIHYFLTSTHQTLVFRPKGQLVWRDVVFQHSLSHPYLLQGILATAALHKTASTSSPESWSRYTTAALSNQGNALASFIPDLNNPVPANCVALFSMSLLLSVWSFASRNLPSKLGNLITSPRPQQEPHENSNGSRHRQSSVDDFIEIVKLMRGVYVVMKETHGWLQEGEIRELLRSAERDSLPPIAKDADEAFCLLENKLNTPKGSGECNPERSKPHDYNIYAAERQVLRHLFRIQQCAEWADNILGWPVMLPTLFMESLKDGDPGALAILMYWAACFNVLDEVWWSRGWAHALVVDIWSILDDSWKAVLRWPMLKVGVQGRKYLPK